MAEGIIGSNRTVKNPLDDLEPPKTGTAAGYDPAQIQLDESKDTVAGRISSVIDANSPLIRSARTRAAQTANSRGLLNSSMAVQAGEMATYDAALPIATQDAATSYDARKTNVGATNAARSQQTTGQQQLEQIGASTAGQGYLNRQQGIISERLARTEGEIQGGLQAQQGDITSRLQAERGQIEKDLLTAEGDQRLKLLDRQGQIDQQLAQTQGDIQSRLQAERGQIDQALLTAEGQQRQDLLTRQGEIDAMLAQVQGDLSSRLQAEQGQINERLQTAEGAIREQLIARQGEIDQQLQQLRNTGAMELTDLENQWRTVLQTSQSAAAIFAETSASIGSILANPDIPAASKQGLINQQRTFLSDSMAVIGGIANLDLGSMLGYTSGGSGDITYGTSRQQQTFDVIKDSIMGKIRV